MASDFDRTLDKLAAPYRRQINETITQATKKLGSKKSGVEYVVECHWADYVNRKALQGQAGNPVDYVSGIFLMLNDYSAYQICTRHLRLIYDEGFRHIDANSHWSFKSNPDLWESDIKDAKQREYKPNSKEEWLWLLFVSLIGAGFVALYLNEFNYWSWYWPFVSNLAEFLPLPFNAILFLAGFAFAPLYFVVPWICVFALLALPFIIFAEVRWLTKNRRSQTSKTKQ